MAQITVVEDNPAIAKLIRLKLESEGHSIHWCSDGQSGLQSLLNNPPELVILDVGLPYINGFDVAKAIREHSRLQAMPILMLTAQSDMDSRLQGLALADDFLAKPFEMRELSARITALLRRSNFNVQAAPLLPPVTELEGKQVNHYQVRKRIGQGGMSVVYQAWDTRLERYVALKFFMDSFDNHQAKARFMREAKAASRIQHENICPVYNVDERPDGHVFMVMPYLQGESLEVRLHRGALETASAVRYTLHIAQGLRAAHQQGFVHRDVKPGNIFVSKANNNSDDEDSVKLLDFGIAKWQHDNSHNLTRTGILVGTINYMSPEQARGETVDARSDVWSLGVVLYEMLTGKRPFGAAKNFIAVLDAILSEEKHLLVDDDSRIPPQLFALLETMLVKDVTKRLDSLEPAINILRDFQLSKP